MKKAYIQPEFEKITLKSAHDFLNESLNQGATEGGSNDVVENVENAGGAPSGDWDTPAKGDWE